MSENHGSTFLPELRKLLRRMFPWPYRVLRALYRTTKGRAQLEAQLTNVGAELTATRRRLETLEARARGDVDPRSTRYLNREQLTILPSLVALLPAEERFVIIDGGARDMEADPRWRAFPPARLRFFSFEADQTEALRLDQLAPNQGLERHVYPAGLGGSSGRARFEHNKASGGSSLLPQNRAVTDRWKFENPNAIAYAREIFYPTGAEEIPVISLRDWARDTGIDEVDFLKLNVQGAELDILKGAGTVMDSVLGILVEVAFVESYKNRPMFSDIDPFLRSAGFTFFDLLAHHYIGRAASAVTAQHLSVVEPKLGQLVSAWGQLIEGHALYLRDPVAPGARGLDPRRTIKLAALAEAFGQIEYAFEILDGLAAGDDHVDPGLKAQINQVIETGISEYRGRFTPNPHLPT